MARNVFKKTPDKKSHEGSFFFTKEQTFMAVLYFVHVFAARRHFFTTNLRLQPQLQFCDISGQVKKNKGFLQPGHLHGVPVLAFQLKQTAAQGQTAVSGPGIFP